MDPIALRLWQQHKQKLKPLVIILALIFAVYLFASYGFITIQTTGGSGQQTITLLNQANNQSQAIATSEASVRRLVRKSSYEVRSQTETLNAWQHIDTSGFFQNKTVNLSLQAEKKRTFVADNPKGCMYYDQQLLSYNCGVTEQGVFVHNPSSGDTPPNVSEITSSGDLQLITTVATNDGVVGLFVVQPESDEVQGALYSFQTLSAGSFQPVGQARQLSTKSIDKDYTAKPYRGGIVLYSTDFSELAYYASAGAEPQAITLPKMNDGYRPTVLETAGQSMAISYQTGDEVAYDSLSTLPKGVKGATTVITDTTAKTFYHDQVWARSVPCGTSKVCAMPAVGERQQMSVLDANSSNLSVLFSINNISEVVPIGNSTLAVTKDGILRLDVDQQTASLDYRFNDYSYCGLGTSRQPNEYVLCVSTSGTNHALLIDSSQTDSDHIDVSANKLRASKSVDTVVIDRRRVFIVLEYGEGNYAADQDSFIDDDTAIAKAQAEVDKLVASLQLTSLGYQVEILL